MTVCSPNGRNFVTCWPHVSSFSLMLQPQDPDAASLYLSAVGAGFSGAASRMYTRTSALVQTLSVSPARQSQICQVVQQRPRSQPSHLFGHVPQSGPRTLQNNFGFVESRRQASFRQHPMSFVMSKIIRFFKRQDPTIPCKLPA